MAAERRDEKQRRTRRKRLIQGLVLGGAAVGLPALVNTVVSRRARSLPPVRWGSGHRFAWRHGELAFQRLGDGPPLVLLHAFGPGHSASEWRAAAEALAPRYGLYAPDLLGWGQSQKPSLTYDGSLYIRQIADFLTDVVGTRATLVAAGLSAAYAVQVAADHPELVHALALIVPLGVELDDDHSSGKDAWVNRLLRAPVLGTSALNLFTSRSSIASYLRREVYGSPELVDDALVDEHYRNSHLPGAHSALAAYVSGYLNHGVRETLPKLEQPVWLAWGRRATVPPVESADLWLRHLDHGQLEVLERCGALPHAESPAELCQKLEHFLAGLEAA